MDRFEELAYNAKACVCRRLKELDVSILEFCRHADLPFTHTVEFLRGRMSSQPDVQEFASRLLLAGIHGQPLWDDLTRRMILAVVLDTPHTAWVRSW
jgi:hypothetical protein